MFLVMIGDEPYRLTQLEDAAWVIAEAVANKVVNMLEVVTIVEFDLIGRPSKTWRVDSDTRRRKKVR